MRIEESKERDIAARVGYPRRVGILARLFGNARAPSEHFVVRSREVAARLVRPEYPNFSSAPEPPCDTCKRPLVEALITTFGPDAEPSVWRDFPVVVDGTVCRPCGTLRYPRNIAPATIHEWNREGAAHGNAGRTDLAEMYFARIVWSWPGYVPGHLNYAEATFARLQAEKDLDRVTRERLVRRAVEHFEAAAYASDGAPADAVLHAHVRLAEVSIEGDGARGFERAKKALERVLSLPALTDRVRVRAAEIDEYMRTRRDLFVRATEVLGPRIALSDRSASPPETPEDRKRLVDAIADLEEHVALAPDRWQSLWFYAKALPLVGRTDDAMRTWERAWSTSPRQRDVARDYSRVLLEATRHRDAREVARAITASHPDDATLWCNLGVTELLCGDLDAADRAIAESLARAPNDRIAALVAKKLREYRAGKALPPDLGALERG